MQVSRGPAIRVILGQWSSAVDSKLSLTHFKLSFNMENIWILFGHFQNELLIKSQTVCAII